MADRKVFVSYSRKDSQKVRPFLDWCAKYSVPTWCDLDDQIYGSSITAKINEAMTECRDAVIFHSLNYAKGAWTQDEKHALVFAQLSFPDRRLIVVKLDETQLDPLLAHRLWADGDNLGTLARFFAGRSHQRDTEFKAAKVLRPDSPKCNSVLNFWESVDASSLERIATVVAGYLEKQGTPTPLECSAPGFECVRLTFYPGIPRHHIDNLKADLDVIEIQQRMILDLRKDLAIGGLGVFATGFKIRYEHAQLKLDASRETLRVSMKAMVRTVCQCVT
jgi:TIR domain-containing protein